MTPCQQFDLEQMVSVRAFYEPVFELRKLRFAFAPGCYVCLVLFLVPAEPVFKEGLILFRLAAA